jgi:uncharacterized protein (DUF302 family)
MQTNQVNVQRWSITSRKPFDTVLAAVEEAIGRPSMVEFAAKVAAATTFEEMQNVINESGEIGLMEFMRLDHGAILAKAGVACDPKSVRVIMGNPLIMQSMARLVPDAGSYAPVTVLVDERADGVHLSYDRMARFAHWHAVPANSGTTARTIWLSAKFCAAMSCRRGS